MNTKTIKASSRASVKVRDNYYTVEWTEERSVPDTLTDAELEEARAELWECCNSQVDNQIADILSTFNVNRR